MEVPTRSLESAVVVVTTVAKSSGVITCNIANPCSANVDLSWVIDVGIVIFVRYYKEPWEGSRWLVHGHFHPSSKVQCTQTKRTTKTTALFKAMRDHCVSMEEASSQHYNDI